MNADVRQATLFDSRHRGQLSMRDYPLEAIAIAGIFVGVPRDQLFSMDAAQLAEVRKPLLRAAMSPKRSSTICSVPIMRWPPGWTATMPPPQM